ncbi:hypothetical protein [Aeromicrobium sp. UC242_57]|uniref:hypothetical protein n=1 Tax=Aeromicrobium sp. UC242_57 TaxID=3374624 RepID=UPI0037BD8CF5
MRRDRIELASWGWAMLGTFTLLVGWQLLGELDLVPRSSLPGPIEVAQAVPTLLSDPEFRSGAADTMLNWFTTVLIGSIAAVAVGLVASSSPMLRRPTELGRQHVPGRARHRPDPHRGADVRARQPR